MKSSANGRISSLLRGVAYSLLDWEALGFIWDPTQWLAVHPVSLYCACVQGLGIVKEYMYKLPLTGYI